MSRSSLWALDEVESAVSASALQLGYPSLRPEQFPAVVAVVRDFDVFLSLPTGYGKSLCFFCLPWAFERLRGHQRQSIVVVVSPLDEGQV